jgi:hypothetical protein
MSEKISIEILLERIEVLEKEVEELKREQCSTEKFKFRSISPKLIEMAYDNFLLLNKSKPKYILIPKHWKVTINMNSSSLGERWSFKNEDGEKKYYMESAEVLYVNGLKDLKILKDNNDKSWKRLSSDFNYGRSSGFYE